jgi:hypothetical protein
VVWNLFGGSLFEGVERKKRKRWKPVLEVEEQANGASFVFAWRLKRQRLVLAGRAKVSALGVVLLSNAKTNFLVFVWWPVFIFGAASAFVVVLKRRSILLEESVRITMGVRFRRWKEKGVSGESTKGDDDV